MNEVICQSCAMPMRADADYGTNADGSRNEDYCTYCYQNGAFTRELTMDEMIDANLQYLDQWSKESGRVWTINEARAELKKFLPTLKRWKND